MAFYIMGVCTLFSPAPMTFITFLLAFVYLYSFSLFFQAHDVHHFSACLRLPLGVRLVLYLVGSSAPWMHARLVSVLA